MSEPNTEYTEQGFWDKVKRYAKDMGESVLQPALKLYYATQDPDVPMWAKTTAYGALAYLISPLMPFPT